MVPILQPKSISQLIPVIPASVIINPQNPQFAKP